MTSVVGNREPLESCGAHFVNYDHGVKPDIAKGVGISGLIDCIHKVIIKKDAFSGHSCSLLTGGHDYGKFGEERKGSTVGGPITIEEGVWIGSFSIILGKSGGTVIGAHSVIGAGAVVAKSVPPYEVWVGNPAKCIKKYNHETKKWEKVNEKRTKDADNIEIKDVTG